MLDQGWRISTTYRKIVGRFIYYNNYFFNFSGSLGALTFPLKLKALYKESSAKDQFKSIFLYGGCHFDSLI